MDAGAPHKFGVGLGILLELSGVFLGLSGVFHLLVLHSIFSVANVGCTILLRKKQKNKN